MATWAFALFVPADSALGETVVDQTETQLYYLTKAREAEELANQAASQFAKETWLKIAKSYRDLLKHEGHKAAKP